MLTVALFQILMNVPRQATVATAAPPVRIQLVRTLASVGVGLMETATPVQVQLLKLPLSAISSCSVCCNNLIYHVLTIALFQILMNVPRQATVATAAPPVRIQLVRTLASVGVGLMETATPVQVQLLKLIFLS